MDETEILFTQSAETKFKEIGITVNIDDDCPIIEGRLTENVFYYDLGFLFDKTEYSREDTEECISEMLDDSKRELDGYLIQLQEEKDRKIRRSIRREKNLNTWEN